MIKDRWYTPAPDGTKAATAERGRGARWEVGYRDRPDGPWKRRRFDRKRHARRFEADMAVFCRADLAALTGVA